MASLNDSPGDFGIDNVELEGDQDLMVASRDFERLASSCYKSGYVEGVEAGKSQGLKEGFSSGFASGLAAATPWAILKGQADALKVFCANQPEAPLPSSLQGTITKIQTEEEKWKEDNIATDRLLYQDGLKRSGESASPDDAVTMETEESVSSRSSSHVTYSELVRNMNTPSTMDSFKARLKPR